MSNLLSFAAKDFLENKGKIVKLEERLKSGEHDAFGEYYSVCRYIRSSHGVDVFDQSLVSFYGVLFGESGALKYYSLADGEIYRLFDNSGTIHSIASNDGCIAFSRDKEIFTFCGETRYYLQDSHVSSLLINPNNMIFSGSKDGIRMFYDNRKGHHVLKNSFNICSSDNYLSSIWQVHSLLSDNSGKVFTLMSGNREYSRESIFSFGELVSPYEINDARWFRNSSIKDFRLGNEIIRYNSVSMFDGIGSVKMCGCVLVPFGRTISNNASYPFTVLSCVNNDCLDLNEEIIEGSRIDEGKITAVELLSVKGVIADVIYSGRDLSGIMHARIDLEKKKFIDKSVFLDGLSPKVYAIEPVRSYSLHETIMGIGKGGG